MDKARCSPGVVGFYFHKQAYHDERRHARMIWINHSCHRLGNAGAMTNPYLRPSRKIQSGPEGGESPRPVGKMLGRRAIPAQPRPTGTPGDPEPDMVEALKNAYSDLTEAVDAGCTPARSYKHAVAVLLTDLVDGRTLDQAMETLRVIMARDRRLLKQTGQRPAKPCQPGNRPCERLTVHPAILPDWTCRRRTLPGPAATTACCSGPDTKAPAEE